jgi:hypothetical protein
MSEDGRAVEVSLTRALFYSILRRELRSAEVVLDSSAMKEVSDAIRRASGFRARRIMTQDRISMPSVEETFRNLIKAAVSEARKRGSSRIDSSIVASVKGGSLCPNIFCPSKRG